MVEFVYAVVTKTPVWVYVLFIFLLMRGIKARKPATVSLEKLAIVPAIFLLWDIYDLVAHHQLTVSSLLMWCSGLVMARLLAIGWSTRRKSPWPAKCAPSTGLLIIRFYL
ncbi:hypothetical protein [Serratia fonticola]|uniref:hypothetical protein n=1 Tax=Serratia fonticola TaxID=47917 RepID=UPI0028F72A55|nr:hypothetical protein [Serratia fonticola]